MSVAQDRAITTGMAAIGLNVETEKPMLDEKTAQAAYDTSTTEHPVTTSLRMNETVPCKIPIVNPAGSSKPPPVAPLTPEQETKYNSVLSTVKEWKEVPAADGKGGPINDDEIFWLSRECILRYLFAAKWATADATKRLLGTLTWRREYGVWNISEEDSYIENATGKLVIAGYDHECRPCLYMNPARQNTEPSPRQVRHLVFMLERTIDLMIPGQHTMCLIIDFKPSKARKNTAPALGQGREVLHILQTHYPERLGKAFNVNIPWIVNGFFKLITPFIDPLTKKKLHFNEHIRPYVPPQHLMKQHNGDLEFEYDHDTYWPALLKLCEERRRAQRARWAIAGKQIGESETYFKGGDAPSISQAISKKEDNSVDEKLDGKMLVSASEEQKTA